MYRKLLLEPIGNFPKFLVILVILWSVFWKGISLWRSARNNQKYWFIALFLLNTVGILEIVYLAFFQKKIEVRKK